MWCGAMCAGGIFRIIGEKNPQMAQIDADEKSNVEAGLKPAID